MLDPRSHQNPKFDTTYVYTTWWYSRAFWHNMFYNTTSVLCVCVYTLPAVVARGARVAGRTGRVGVGHARHKLLNGVARRRLDARAAAIVVLLEQALHLETMPQLAVVGRNLP